MKPQYPPFKFFGFLNIRFSNYYSIGWPDTVQGLSALKKQVIIATLSNGNVRLLIDMVIESIFYSYLLSFKVINLFLMMLLYY